MTANPRARPSKWARLTMPTDEQMREHAEWVERHGEELLPNECFYCWALEQARQKATL